MQYRKKNRAVRHEYYTLSSRHTALDCYMFTFTSGKGGTYQKLRLINEIKTYVTYLIANSKAEIYFFSNIEVGHSFTNPHLHTQLWCDDLNALRAIYDKVLAKFSLVKKRCSLSEPQRSSISYNYVIKDYAEDLSDNRLWNIECAKKRMREKLRTKVRFYSKSKSKYTQKAYRYFYRYFGVLRGVADEFIDWFLDIFFNKDITPNTPQRSVSWSKFLVLFIYKEQGVDCLAFYLLVDFMGRFFDFLLILFYSPAQSPPVYEARVRIFMLKEFDMLLWIRFYYPVLFEVWVCMAGELLFALLVYGVIVFGVEARCLSPPVVVLVYGVSFTLVLLLVGGGRNSGAIVIFGLI